MLRFPNRLTTRSLMPLLLQVSHHNNQYRLSFLYVHLFPIFHAFIGPNYYSKYLDAFVISVIFTILYFRFNVSLIHSKLRIFASK